MDVSNNSIGNIQSFGNRTNRKPKVSKSTSIHADKDAVRIIIDPRTLASKEYKDILKENNHFPIVNPDVLSYDNRLYLRRYSKVF